MPSSDGQTLKKSITRLDEEELEVTCYQKDGSTTRDITNDTLTFEARFRTSDPEPIFAKSSDNPTEIEKLDQTANRGKAVVYIGDADTTAITRTTTLQCQLTMTDPQGRDSTIMFSLPFRYRT